MDVLWHRYQCQIKDKMITNHMKFGGKLKLVALTVPHLLFVSPTQLRKFLFSYRP